jgi:UDP-N-acetylmuramate dehydrogenase
MLQLSTLDSRLLSLLRGQLRPNADIARNTWFQVGGPAEWLFKPADAEDLAAFLREKPPEMQVTIIGVSSNLLVRDGGVDGVVVRLGRGFTEMEVADRGSRIADRNRTANHESQITIGAGCLDIHTAAFARDHGIAGLEFLCGIPGTIGGAVAMNAGAYGSDISQVLVEAEIVTAQGELRTLSAAELGFSYRHSALPEGAIVTRATLRGTPGEPAAITVRMDEIRARREATQPIRSKTGGSTFKNPPGHKAWELIGAAGCRGKTRGGAKVSEQHCNFLINTGNATAADLEDLGEEVREAVLAHSGIAMEWEIKRMGKR